MSKTRDGEVLQLRKQLIQKNNEIADLQEELEEKTNLYMNAIKDRDQYKERLENIKSSVNRVETVVQEKVNHAIEKERQELLKLREETKLYRQRLELFDQEREQQQMREKQLVQQISDLNEDLKFYTRNVDSRDAMKRIEVMRDEKDAKDRKIIDLTKQINDLSNNCEDLLAETRTLRKMANVPANYGIPLEQVKLYDREKIDDFKRLIRVLQEDNYRLEEERAKLKQMIKQMSMMYKASTPSDRYKDLTADQLLKLDEYVLRLKQGDAGEIADFQALKKENEKLRNQLEILNTKGFDFIKQQIEHFFKQNGFGDSNKQLERLMVENDEIRRMIQRLLEQGIQGGTTTHRSDMTQNLSRFRPPMPIQQMDGDISQGYSFKFGTHMDVVDKNGRPGIGDTNRYDTACLQLQLCECLEIIKRKDENLTAQQLEIDFLYKRVRDYLLIQDQLYKDYVAVEKSHKEKYNEMEVQLRNVKDSLAEETLKNKNLEQLVNSLKKGGKESIENKIIELTKQNSILEVNLMRLTRKYQTLAEQEELIRREYHNKEADMAEKDKFVQDRINKLKEWKARAIQQLRFLFSKLRMAVPLTEYQTITNDLDIFKHKNADLIDRNAKMAQKLSKLQKQNREFQDAEEKVRNLQEIIDDTENELEVIKRRLANLDPNFKWEIAVFDNIVTTLKRAKVSPLQAFEHFDQNKDGKLQKEEFFKALTMMKIGDMSHADFDVLWKSMDVDSDGSIQYKEFIRKLARHGVRSRTSEEQIIFLIVEGLKKSKINSLSDAFEIIDKERKGTISKEDFKDIFRNLNLKVSEQEIDKFIDHFWKDKVGGIDYPEFMRIFNRYQIRLENEIGGKRAGSRLSDEVVKYKKEIFSNIDKIMKEQKVPMQSLFAKVDVDKSDKIDLDEFISMFEKMKLQVNRQYIADIFSSIDFDGNGQISYSEFIYDFRRYCDTPLRDLLREERDKGQENDELSRQKTLDKQHQQQKMDMMGKDYKASIESQLQTRISILEAREKQLARKLETAMKISSLAEQQRHESQLLQNNLEKNLETLSNDFITQKDELKQLHDELSKSIRKEEAQQIKKLNEQLQTDLVETKSAMLSYKNMTEVIGDQVKGLKLIIERKKDENENLIGSLRDLQSYSEDHQRLGKLYYLVMLSRWQEAAVNKKYDMILSENKELRRELMNTDTLYQNLEGALHESENTLQEVSLQLEKTKQQLSNSKNLYLTIEKAEYFNNVIAELSDDKSELEEQYLKVRSECFDLILRMESAEVNAQSAEEMLKILKDSNQTELSDKILEVSDKIKTFRLQSMRAERQANELNERNNYLGRQVKYYCDSVKKLEEQVSEFESRMHKREEEFRRADNERMRRFFNARFDDIGGALNKQGTGDILGERQPIFPSSVQRAPSFGSPKKYETYSRQASEAQRGTGTADTDVKILENKCRRLQEELKNATDVIRAQEGKIKRFSDWQLADKYLSQDEYLKDAIERNQAKSTALQEQEQKEMAEAAFQTIKTLQEMLDQKNNQLKSKEEHIEKIRKQMELQRNLDAQEIAKLQQQNTLAAGTTLNKLQEIVLMNEGKGKGSKYDSRYERLSRDELQAALDEKDHKLQQMVIERDAFRKEKQQLMREKENQNVTITDLEDQLRNTRAQNESKAKQVEVQRLQKQLNEKNTLVTSLKAAIDKLNERMTQYEISQSNLKEDNQGTKLLAVKETEALKRDLQAAKEKVKMMESSRNQKAEELKNLKVREQELKEKFQKVTMEKEDLAKTLANLRNKLDQEQRTKEKLQIQVNQIQSENKIGANAQTGLSYEALRAKVKELENDIMILQCQTKTVVVYNKESGTFEYIGDPIFLNKDSEVTDIEDMLNRIRTWLARNERLTVKSIFESLDPQQFGELPEAKFDLAFQKMGIKLRRPELILLKEILDPRNIGFLRYRPLVRELMGIPQLDFICREIIKVGRLVELRDLDRTQFKKLVDPTGQESMYVQEFQNSFRLIQSENFAISDQEVEAIFKNITKSARTTGLTISIARFTEKVFQAVDALLIEKVKDAVLKSQKTLSELFAKHDSNKDGLLEYQEFENLLLDCQVAFKPNLLKRIINLMDPDEKRRKVSYESFKFYVSDGFFSAIQGHLAKSLDYEPSLEKATLSQETSTEELGYCKAGARKLLLSCQNNILELLQGFDKNKEGILSREDIQKFIYDQKIMDMTGTEINMLLKHCDKNNKGYIGIEYFISKLQEWAVETKQDVILRRFANLLKHQGINLRLELQKHDQSRSGRLEKKVFYKAMKQLAVALTDEEIDILFQAGESPEFKGTLDIKLFCDKVTQALKSKPLPSFIGQPKTKGVSSKIPSSDSQAFGNWEAEKKFKKKLEALQQQVEESRKETQAAEKQSRHWQEVSNKLEKEKNNLQARLVDVNAKPPKASQYESLNQGQIEEIQSLKDQLYYLQEENLKKEHTIAVKFKSELSRVTTEKEKLEEKVKSLQDQNRNLENQIQRLIGKPMDSLAQREEQELWREKKIHELEDQLHQTESELKITSDHLFTAEEKLLDLRFIKENFDLQTARLQKRITDLEQYKLASSKYSATIKKNEEDVKKNIEESSAVLNTQMGATQQKKGDTNKIRNKSSTSVVELETVIESLKRVIDKLNTENDNLKRQIAHQEKKQDKLKSEKILRQKIESLEQEIHSYEMKEVNLDAKDKNIKKLIEANKDLREKLSLEVERYNLLESKYKDVLVKYNIICKENDKNFKSLFHMSTGGQVQNYDEYLMRNDDDFKASKSGGAQEKGRSLERNFEEML